MKPGLLSLLLLSTIPSFGQVIEKIIFTSEDSDEPPTKQGRPTYKIEFSRQVNGELSTSKFTIENKTQKLKNAITIDADQAARVAAWQTAGKPLFTPQEIGLNVASLQSAKDHYYLNFDIPTDFVVNIDSFEFCQPYKLTKAFVSGGETIAVTLLDSLGKKSEFSFYSSDIGRGSFNLKAYLLCFTLLKDKIPGEIPSHDFFSIENLNEIMLYYQKTVECEGFYYQEYLTKNPQLTTQEKRMMTSWNFLKYLRERNEHD